MWEVLVIYLLIFGGSAFGCEFSGIAESLIDTIKEIRMLDIEVETAREELESKKLENYSKAIELIEDAKEFEIDYDDIKSKMELISTLEDSLQFQTNEEFAVVDEKDKGSNKTKGKIEG